MINVVCKLIYRDNLSMKARVGVPCAPREPTIEGYPLELVVPYLHSSMWVNRLVIDGESIGSPSQMVICPLFSSSHHRSQAISSKITKTGQNDSTTAPLTFNLHFFGTRQRQKTMNGFPYSLMWLGYY